MADILIFQSKILSHADQVAIALDDAGVSYYRKQKIGSIEMEMDDAPVEIQNASWLIYVPKTVADQAREIVKTFPFGDERNIYSSLKKPMSPEFLRTIMIIFLALVALVIFLVMINIQ